MIGLVLLVLSVVGADSQGSTNPRNPTYFVGNWTNVSGKPGGASSFSVAQESGRTFLTVVSTGGTDRLEATVYALVPSPLPAGYRPEASALMASSGERVYIVKKAPSGGASLETYTKLPDSSRLPLLVIESYVKDR